MDRIGRPGPVGAKFKSLVRFGKPCQASCCFLIIVISRFLSCNFVKQLFWVCRIFIKFLTFYLHNGRVLLFNFFKIWKVSLSSDIIKALTAVICRMFLRRLMPVILSTDKCVLYLCASFTLGFALDYSVISFMG